MYLQEPLELVVTDVRGIMRAEKLRIQAGMRESRGQGDRGSELTLSGCSHGAEGWGQRQCQGRGQYRCTDVFGTARKSNGEKQD